MLGRPGGTNLKGTTLDQKERVREEREGPRNLVRLPPDSAYCLAEVMAISVNKCQHKVVPFACVTRSSEQQSGRNSWRVLAPAHIFHAQGST